MKKTRFYIILCVIVAAVIMLCPALYSRSVYENKNTHAVISVNYSDEMTEAQLEKYALESGITAVLISENDKNEFDAHKLENAEKLGLEVVPSVSASKYVSDTRCAYIEEIVKKYNVKYINICGENEEEFSDAQMSESLCRVISKNNLTLVLSETNTQLSNEKPAGYDEYVKSANGRIMRGYETDKKNSLNRVNYDLIYYQMLNSLVDRNIRFFTVNTIEDKNLSDDENVARTVRAVKKFSDKSSELGYTQAGGADLAGYDANRRLISASSAMLMTVMLFIVAMWVFGKKKLFDIFALITGVIFTSASFVLPESLLWVYPTLYSVVAPCFAITAACVFVLKYREKLSYVKLCIFGIAGEACLLCVTAVVMCALLSGADYYINTLVFKGVKLSLIAPVMYSALLFLFAKGVNGKLRLKSVKELSKQYFKKKYIITALCAFVIIAVIGAIYIFRSGNAMIPFSEAYIRNLITEMLLARPRTKEFMLAWPAFALFLVCSKKYPDGILQWIFGSVSAMLCASVINTFCHVFTPMKIMYLRVFHGIWMSIPFIALSLLIAFVIVKTADKRTKST